MKKLISAALLLAGALFGSGTANAEPLHQSGTVRHGRDSGRFLSGPAGH